ncbi:MAG TPA: hypothetical protein VMV92_04565 [Streptosporangiaceae bacterium]|nr:hypothetical protein [Streptosporangiaceae bacterium]
MLHELQRYGPATACELADLIYPAGRRADSRTRAGRAWHDTLIQVRQSLFDLEHSGQVVGGGVRTRGSFLYMVPSDAVDLLNETRQALNYAAEYALNLA